MFSSTKRSRPGRASAESKATSYWPRTRVPRKPSMKPIWRVTMRRLARPAKLAPKPGSAGRAPRSEPSRRPTRSLNVPMLAAAQPARSTTACRSTTPGSGRPRRASRRGTMRSMVAAQAGSLASSSAADRLPGARRSLAAAMASAVGQSTRPCRAMRSARRPAHETATPAPSPTMSPMRHGTLRRSGPMVRRSALMPRRPGRWARPMAPGRRTDAGPCARRRPRRRSSAGCAPPAGRPGRPGR